MVYYKKFDNGLRLVVHKMAGLFTVSCGVLVKTGSVNETDAEHGISHFIEHSLFKGTEKRTAFEISDYVDRIGAQINAYTSKETTCYYTKSTAEHFEDSLEVLSDIFFNSTLVQTELDKEKGVVTEEINMCEDEPEDLCLDLLAESFYGKDGLGRTILGTTKNVKSFSRADLIAYMDKFYTADNVVISVAGNVEEKQAEELAEKYFASKFVRLKSAPQKRNVFVTPQNLYRTKRTEQSHIGLCMPALCVKDERSIALNIANTVFGGGMSSRLFQRIREDMGLAYSIYSYMSSYKDCGVLEIYAGVNTSARESAEAAIAEEIKKIAENGVTEQEFLRGKEQIKSAFIMGQESTASQMLLYGRYLLMLDELFDFEERVSKIENTKIEEVNSMAKEIFDLKKASTATVGPKRSPLKIY